ncbi:MAG: hypothetical protein ABS98_04510 [Lysobacteraceae bacterium SCN 69-48]|nr:MAG: hypothetical protein ABS98_04510 [Xanthomonadaceae bacterium SCN 69-48]
MPPSAENAGEFTLQPSGETCFGGAMSRVTRLRIHSVVVDLLVALSTVRLANTSTRPSGDSVGEEWRSM